MGGLCFLCQGVTFVLPFSENVMLQKNVEVIFLMRHLLEIPVDACCRYLEKYGNPVEWVHLCESCLVIVHEGKELFGKIQRLQHDLGQVRCKVQCQLKVKPEPLGEETNEQFIIPLAGMEIRRNFLSREEQEDDGFPLEFEINPDHLLNGPAKHLENFSFGNHIYDSGGSSPRKKHTAKHANEQKINKSTGQRLISRRVRHRKKMKVLKNEVEGGDNSNEIIKKCPRERPKKNIGQECSQEIVEQLNAIKLKKTRTIQLDVNQASMFDDAANLLSDRESINSPENYDEDVSMSSFSEADPDSSSAEEWAESKKKGKRQKDTKPKTPSKRSDKSPRLPKPMRTVLCQNQECSETFHSATALKAHMTSAHPSKRKKATEEEEKGKLSCPEESCRKRMASLRYLEDHVRIFHTPVAALTCSGCSVVFTDKVKYRRHLNEAQPEDACVKASIKCSQCDVRVGSQEALDIHSKIRHILRMSMPFNCKTCNKSYASNAGLQRHYEEEHSGNRTERPFVCDKCGHTFRLNRHLLRHLNDYHGPEMKYPCRTCGKEFGHPGHRNRHQKLHREENPHQCTLCGKCFKLKNYLTIHMWSHDPDRKLKYSLYKPKPKDTAKRKRKTRGDAATPTCQNVDDASITSSSGGNFSALSIPHPQVASFSGIQPMTHFAQQPPNLHSSCYPPNSNFTFFP